MEITAFSPEIILGIFVFTTDRDLIACGQTCTLFAETAETEYKRRALRKGWALPRRPRGEDRLSLWPWRTLFLSRMCKACHGEGEFQILTSRHAQIGLLCRKCVLENDGARSIMAREMYNVSAESIHGKPLINKSKKK